MKYFILFGPPGAGKGTQASAMVEQFNLKHISTGALLREEIAAGTELGLQAKALIDAGSLVPDEVVEGMIESQFKTVKGVNGFLLDGFPRTIAQAEALDKMLAKSSEEVTGVVSIMIPDNLIMERIKHRATIEGRADDAKEETINNRIKTYHDKTEPLVGFYQAAGKFQAWITRIAHNLIIDYYRDKANENLISNDEVDYDLLNDANLADSSHESQLVNKQTLNDVKLLCQALPESQSEVVRMRYYYNMSFREIADTLGISINTALGRMRYALINMRRMATEKNISLEIN